MVWVWWQRCTHTHCNLVLINQHCSEWMNEAEYIVKFQYCWLSLIFKFHECWWVAKKRFIADRWLLQQKMYRKCGMRWNFLAKIVHFNAALVILTITDCSTEKINFKLKRLVIYFFCFYCYWHRKWIRNKFQFYMSTDHICLKGFFDSFSFVWVEAISDWKDFLWLFCGSHQFLFFFCQSNKIHFNKEAIISNSIKLSFACNYYKLFKVDEEYF